MPQQDLWQLRQYRMRLCTPHGMLRMHITAPLIPLLPHSRKFVTVLPCRKALGQESTAEVDYQAVLQLQPSNKEAAEALEAMQT